MCDARFRRDLKVKVSMPVPLLQYLERYSRLGITLAVIWLVLTRPFWRHVCVALSAMAFAVLLLPAEMMFFARHPLLAFAVPFTAGFVGVHLGRNRIGTLAAWAVLGILAVATYRAILETW
jgi:hypothetical protein